MVRKIFTLKLFQVSEQILMVFFEISVDSLRLYPQSTIRTNIFAKTKEYVNRPKSSVERNLAKIKTKKKPDTSLLIVVIVENEKFFFSTDFINLFNKWILIFGIHHYNSR